jgi:diguanylate cyclase (GGDEF)-like protein
MNAATYLIDIFALCYLCGVMRSSTMMKSKRIKPFTIAIALALVSTLSEIGAILASEQSDLRTLHILCNAVGFALAPMIPLALIAIFDVKLLGRHKEILLPTAINLFAVALSPVNGKIFYVNAANQYFRGEFYPIFVAVYVFNLLMLLFYTLYITRKHRYPIIGKVASLLLFTIVCTIIQIAYPTAYSTWHCVTVSLVLYYLLMSDFDSSFDALSGLFNRISFDKVVRQMAKKESLVIVVLDINDFKVVNDTYGHSYGDKVIQEIATTMRDTFDGCCSCYRIGGDEFAVIFDVTDPDLVEQHLQKMTNALSEKRKADSRLPTIAYGYSILHKGGEWNFEQSFHDADIQMYQQKKLNQAENGKTNEING